MFTKYIEMKKYIYETTQSIEQMPLIESSVGQMPVILNNL